MRNTLGKNSQQLVIEIGALENDYLYFGDFVTESECIFDVLHGLYCDVGAASYKVYLMRVRATEF